VCATDINHDELARCARDLAADGTEFQTLRSDVADLAECQSLVNRIVARWGRLDVVVHNAIYMPLITFEETTPEEWSRQINVGIGGLFNCTHAVWDQMKAQGGGHIIGIASGSSIRGYKKEIAYCTIKHGIEGFVKAISFEAKTHNIAINTIGPGARIKPTRATWAEYDQAPTDLRATWTDPAELGKAWVWLAAQSPSRFCGYRFDAAKLVQTIAREGADFEFAAEKVTLYPDDFRTRQEWYSHYVD
jgi:NAD(P)-dependent dehydrogenase (short-subunit alcohol dehydrogenase family)